MELIIHPARQQFMLHSPTPTGFNPVTGSVGLVVYGCWHRVQLPSPKLIRGVRLMRHDSDVDFVPDQFKIYRSMKAIDFDLVYTYSAGGITWGANGVYSPDTFEWDPVYAEFIVIVITAKIGNAQTNMQLRAIDYY